ncbi:MAG: hypothetical protein OEX07_01760 [Gammaproteobacteria bacterium]|nr:hypothetical protein [Gammaproteobacteria bacterium]
MDKKDFKQDTRYTVTLRDENNKLRPANLYVMRMHEDGMVVRMTDKAASLMKIKYENVVKIVNSKEVEIQNRFTTPDAVLNEQNWKDRTSLDHYSSSSHMGK